MSGVRVVASVLLLLGTAYIWRALSIPVDPWLAEEPVNTRTLPLVYGSLLCLLSVVLLFRHDTDASFTLPRAALVRLGGLVGAMLLFAWLVPRTGVWLAIPFLLLPAMWIMGERRWWVLGLAPALTALAGWLLIAELLDLYIDPGSWWT